MAAPKRISPVAHDYVLPKGRVITLGASARKRERFLGTGLGVVSAILVSLLVIEGLMFHKGTLVYAPNISVSNIPDASLSAAVVGSAAVSSPAKPKVETVVATMAPIPPTGKYDDIILPAQKPSTTPGLAPVASLAPPADAVATKSSPSPEESAAMVATNFTSVTRAKAAPVPLTPTARVPVKATTLSSAAPGPLTAPQSSNPELKAAYNTLIQGNYAEALMMYDRVLDHDPKNIEALKGKAYALEKTDQFEAAADINREIMKLGPTDAEASQ